jgi:hypothetical protein
MRKLLLTIILIIIGQPALATPSPDELRAMAYSGNVDGIEAAYVAIHAEQRAGGMSYTELRELYLALIVFDPRVMAFTDNWLEGHPDSPHAHAIRAWQLYNSAFAIRGNRVSRDTYFLALEGFDELRYEALSHAWIAYGLAPDLVPASDALLSLQTPIQFLGSTDFGQFLGDVMTITPNHQSLILATSTALPQWGGGGPPIVREICDRYSSVITDVENYNSDICFIEAMLNRDHYWSYEPAAQEALALLSGQDHPILDYIRFQQAVLPFDPGFPEPENEFVRLDPEGARAAAEVAGELIQRPDYVKTGDANSYDNAFAIPLGLPRMLPEVIARQVDWAEQRIVEDPFDPAAIATLAHTNFFDVPVPNPLPIEQIISLMKRQALVKPFDPEIWRALGDLVVSQQTSYFSTEADLYYINSIVYSNYDLYRVQHYLQVKYEFIKHAIYAEEHELRGRYISEALFTDGFCPFLQLENLKTYLCEGPRSDNPDCAYGWGPGPEQVYAEALQRATDANLCIAERRANPEDLFFQPIEVDRQP